MRESNDVKSGINVGCWKEYKVVDSKNGAFLFLIRENRPVRYKSYQFEKPGSLSWDLYSIRFKGMTWGIARSFNETDAEKVYNDLLLNGAVIVDTCGNVRKDKLNISLLFEYIFLYLGIIAVVDEEEDGMEIWDLVDDAQDLLYDLREKVYDSMDLTGRSVELLQP